MHPIFRLLSILLLAAAAFGCAVKGKAPALLAEPAPYTVMTWNIRVGVGPGAPAPKDPATNLQAIAEVILREKADFVLLQEVDRGSDRTGDLDELAILADATGMNMAWAPAIEDDTMRYGIGILSRLPIAEAVAVPLPRIDYAGRTPAVPDYYGEQRMALVARVDGGAVPMALICTHLGLTREQRMLQTATIARLAEAEHAAGRTVILGGDFNAEPDGLELYPIRQLLRDAYHGHRDRNSLEYDLSIRDRLTFPTKGPDRCIDFLFVTPGRLHVESTAILPDPLSDHLAVTARLLAVR